MKFKNICFLIQTPLSERDYKRFGAERLQSRGFDVFFMDLSQLVNPDYVSGAAKAYPYKNSITVTSMPDFEVKLASFSGSALFIDIIGGRPETLFIYRAFTRLNLPYAELNSNTVPVPGPSLAGKIYRTLKQVPYDLALSLVRRPDFVVRGGSRNVKRLPYPSGKTELIWAHTLDYDLYLDHINGDHEAPANGKYAVFLDEYFPFHPDYQLTGGNMNPFSDPDVYFNELNEMFGEIENKLGMTIIIAAHPRSNYAEVGNRFKGRKIVQSSTLELTANASLILAHASTSINFAVLFDKPVVFMMPEKVKHGGYGRFIRNFADCLGKTPLDIQTIRATNLKQELTVNKSKYGSYKQNYIKTKGSPEKHYWDIVADRLQ